MTVILVNRDLSSSHKVTVNLSNFTVANGIYNTLQLAALPTTETFVSHTNNALKKTTVTLSGNSFSIVLPTLSTTAILLKSTTSAIEKRPIYSSEIQLYPNPVRENLNIKIGSQSPDMTDIAIYSQDGKLLDAFKYNYDGKTAIKINNIKLINGLYLLRIKNNNFLGYKRFIIRR
jgi:hypothetical protein